MTDRFDGFFEQPEQAAPQDRFAGYFDQQEAQNQQQVEAVLEMASRTNPDQAAKARTLATETGLPADVAERNLPDVERRARAVKLAEAVAVDPILRQQLTNPDFAKIAHDDVEQLGLGARALEGMRDIAVDYGLRVPAEGHWRLGQSVSGAARAVAGTLAPLLDPLAGTILPENPLRRAEFEWANQARQIGRVADEYGVNSPDNRSGFVGRSVQSGLASVVQNLHFAPLTYSGAATGATVPTARAMLPMGMTQAGASYTEARDKGLSNTEALLFGVAQGGVEMGTEALPLGRLLSDMKVGSPLWKTMAKQLAAENVGEQVATHVQDLNEWATLNPDKGFADFLAERPEAALQTLIATTAAVGAQTGPVHLANFRTIQQNRAAQADKAQAALQQLQQVAQGSALNKRAPDAFAQFMQTVADDHGTPEVHVSAQVFNQALESANIDPASVLAKLPQEVQESYAQALQTGGDLTIPTGEAVGKLLANEEGNALVPHLRFGPDDMSFSEREQFRANEQRQLMEDLREVLEAKQIDQAWQASGQKVEDDVFAQLMQTGRYAEDAARKQSVLHRAFASTMAAQIDLMPEQAYDAARLYIQGNDAGGYQQGVQVGFKDGTQFLEAKTDAGMVGGNVRDGVLRISVAEVAESSRGKGEGVRLYSSLIDRALADGLRVFSDSTVEAGAVRVYESLKRRGYDVRRLDGGTLEDGAAYGVGAEQPAFEVVAGPSSFAQDARGTFNPDTNTIALLEGANLSTFLHESGHYFLETLLGFSAGPNASQRLKEDAQKILDWFGVESYDAWYMMTVDQKREHHEKWARTFEGYLLEGRAPSVELQGVFRTFRAWLVSIYKSLKNLNADLTPEVRGVMDRMLATDEEIQTAEYARSMMPLFDAEQSAGVDADELRKMHEAHKDATQEAIEKLQARSLRDLKWSRNAQSRALKALQKEADELRQEEQIEARREVMQRPLYQAWAWLTGKPAQGDGRTTTPESLQPKSDPDVLDPRVDSLMVAIAKLGGIERESAVSLWGLRADEKPASGLFGKPVLRAKGKGYSVDEMAAKLAEYGYLGDVADVETLRAFEEMFFDEMAGALQYSNQHTPAPDARPGELDEFDPLDAGKLDRDTVRAMFGRDHPAVAFLSAQRMIRKQGWHPDLIAEHFGFESGDAMIRELAAAQPPQAEIEALTDMRMLEKHGDLATPEAIQRAADEAVHNEARARAVAAELAALATVSGSRKIPREAAQDYAQRMIARLQVRNIKPHLYAAAAARAGKASMEAMKAGDTQRAFTEKRNQLIQTYAAKYAADAVAEAKATRTQFHKVVTSKDDTVGKTRDLDLVNVARAVLASYGFAGKAGKAVTYVDKLAEYDPAMHDAVKDIVQRAQDNAKPFEALTVEELRGLKDEIDSLWLLAKRNRQMKVDGDLLDRQDVATELRNRLEEIGIPETMPGDASAITPKERALKHLQDATATLIRAEQWAERMDGTAAFGVFRRFIFTPIKEAADRYRADRVKYLRGMRDAIGEVSGTFKRELIAAPELGYTFGKEAGAALNEVFHAILHTGNDSNKRKLLLGRGWAQERPDGSVDTARWDAFIARLLDEGKLTRAHFDAAQKVWDLLESMKPAAQRAHRDAYGKSFDEVTANAFDVRFPDGTTATYSGGYVPATPDSRIVKDNELRKLLEEGKEGMAYAFPGTAKGFTKGRVEYNRPLMLDVRTLGQHIDKVLQFSHLEMPVRDASRLLAMPQVSHALNRVDPTAISGVLMPWLNRAARQQVTTPVPGAQGLMKLLSTMRSRAGMALMFANVSNTVQQLAGFPLAAVKVPARQLLVATAEFVRHPRQMADNVRAASIYMSHRMDNQAEAMMGEVYEMLVNPTAYQSAQEWSKRNAYFLQSLMDNIMGPIIWTGAYRDAIAKGLDDRDAVRLADSAIRTTQGSTLPEDVSRIETGPAYARLFTQFVGYFNMQGNTLAAELAKAKEQGGKAGAMRAASVLFMGFFATAWMAEAVTVAFRGGEDDDDKDGEYLDDWLQAVFLGGPAKNATALVPFAGPAIQTAMNTWNSNPIDDRYSVSPTISLMETAIHTAGGRSIYNAAVEDGNRQRAIRQLGITFSLATGLPVYAATRPLGYAAGVDQGKINPASTGDAVRGLVTGTASPKSR